MCYDLLIVSVCCSLLCVSVFYNLLYVVIFYACFCFVIFRACLCAVNLCAPDSMIMLKMSDLSSIYSSVTANVISLQSSLSLSFSPSTLLTCPSGRSGALQNLVTDNTGMNLGSSFDWLPCVLTFCL